jgi:hypothetical protein
MNSKSIIACAMALLGAVAIASLQAKSEPSQTTYSNKPACSGPMVPGTSC